MTNPSFSCLKLPVHTVSGQHLGRVCGVEVDASAKQVIHYEVAAAVPLAQLWGKKLLISPEQVVSISQQAMVVVDTFSREMAPTSTHPNLAPEPSA
ncbi:MAG: hypothetical protein Q8P77_02485 [Candidatus Veblenbacteria bacterium]|nr:hypothetical protein [Candidatus Veblenbacteria bacterium]